METVGGRMPEMQGAKQGMRINTSKGEIGVVEFDNEKDRDAFIAQARSQGIKFDVDRKIHPYVAEVNENAHRKLAESVPWGIEDVFKRSDGTIDIPGPDYFPDQQLKKVCIIDSGYQVSHPDLVNTATNADPNQGDTYSNDPCGHGSHVAGSILATDNDEGVIGVYPGASSLIVKVFFTSNCGWAYTSSLIQAATYCKEAGADIISMSLGSSYYSQTEDAAFTALYENDDILSIAAAGNGGSSAKSYPASHADVMSVGAADVNENIAGFSQFNDAVDIAGPGVGVLSTVGSGYLTYSGTSMATPHVSAVALLLWNKYPGCTAVEIRTALEQGAKDKGAPGRDNYYGHGLVKYWGSVEYLNANPCAPPPPTPPPTPPQPTASPTPWSCDEGVPFVLSLTTDNYGGETSWDLKVGGNTKASGSGYSNNSDYTEQECLVEAGEYTFTINDTWGDGICCSYGSGSYELTVNGESIKTGGEFGSTESVTFTVDLSPTVSSPPPTSPPTIPPTSPPTIPSTLSPSANPIAPPTPSPTSPTSPTPPSPGCPAGEAELEVSVTTNNYSSQTNWVLSDTCNSETVFENGCSDSNAQADVKRESRVVMCIIKDNGYSFTINNPYGESDNASGSYSVKFDGVVVISNGFGFGSSETTDFGECPPAPTTSPSVTPSVTPSVSPTTYPTGSPVDAATVNPSASPISSAPVALTPTPTIGATTEVTTGETGTAEYEEVFFNDFETPDKWGNFESGGSNAIRYIGGTHAMSGNAALRIRNSGEGSDIISTEFDVTNYSAVVVSFVFKARGLEDGEAFALEYSVDGGATYDVQNTWRKGVDFDNDAFRGYVENIEVKPDNVVMKIRFIPLGDENNDKIFIDNVQVDGLLDTTSV